MMRQWSLRAAAPRSVSSTSLQSLSLPFSTGRDEKKRTRKRFRSDADNLRNEDASSLFRGALKVGAALIGGKYSHKSSPSLEKIGATAYAAAGALRNPYDRGDLVGALGELTGEAALKNMRDKMAGDAYWGARILRDRPLIEPPSVTLEFLRSMPDGSFGKCLYNYHAVHGFEFGKRPPVERVEDEELAYVMNRYRQVHDLLHVLTGCPVSVSGEVALKWFEMTQTQLPMTALAAVFGTLRAEPTRGDGARGSMLWAVRSAEKCEFLLNVPYEEKWELPLAELRRELKLDAFPGDDYVPSIDAALHPEGFSDKDLLRIISHYESAAAHEGKGSGESTFDVAVGNLKKLL